MKKLYTISAFTENSPGVLHRITVMFTRRKINIESLTVSETEKEGTSRFTIVVKVEENLVRTIVKQINRIIEVKAVYAYLDEDLVFKEIAFIRVKSSTPEDRSRVEQHAHWYGAKVVYAEPGSLVLETTGTSDEIKSLLRLLEAHGVEEFIQSGRIAIAKHKNGTPDRRPVITAESEVLS
ncbi:MAG: acetolactate synthase small subunit [Deltaproteobacteria bacterium]|nr:acetolactate synthase small subunit [Deltaproteobacteria bacterium]